MIKQTNHKQTKIGEIPDGWILANVEDFAELRKESYRPNGENESPYIGLEHINQDSLSLNGVGNSSEVISNKYRFYSGDILFGKLRPYFRKVYHPNFDGVCSTDIWVLKPKNQNNADFLFYFVANSDFVNMASSGSTGTKMPRANWDQIKNSQWVVPIPNEQQQIAFVLSTLDDKIELNRRMNKTLEEMGKALFKYWFVDFEFPDDNGKPYKSSGGEIVNSELGKIPKGWLVKSLSDIADFQNGFAFYTLGYSLSGMKVVDLLNIDTLGIFKESDRDKFVSEEIYMNPRFAQYILRKDDLVMAMTDMTQDMGILGKCGRIYHSDKFILNQRIGRFRARKGINVNFLQSYLNSPIINEHLKNVSLGTVQKYVNTYHIMELKFIIPPKNIMTLYSSLVDSVYTKIRDNNFEIRTLTQLRDSLLPRLMSGKLRVN